MNSSKQGQHQFRSGTVEQASPTASTKTAQSISHQLTQAHAVFSNRPANALDLICLSHLRWDFVYQRPQHLLSRCAKERRVFFIEEPIFGNESVVWLDVSQREDGVRVAVPRLPETFRDDAAKVESAQQSLIDQLIQDEEIDDYILWYYTPMAMAFTRQLQPHAVVYDCMDELSAFKNAPRALKECEAELFRRADLVFTGGQSLYEAKRSQHPRVYAFPSSIDTAHFKEARDIAHDPADQREIPHPRMGYCGVIDERLDLELIDGAAEARPDWQFVMIGPVVKIDPATLPRRPNIHYLGGKNYKELPAYLSGWDVALMPFARNESTRFISPTKTPEYLAAGKPVVSTSIRDVVRPYGQQQMVHIADTVTEFVAAIETAMGEDASERMLRADAFLGQNSWNKTWTRMSRLIAEVVATHRAQLQNTGASSTAMPLRARAAAAGSFATGD